MKRFRQRIPFALLLGLFPLSSHADVGSLGGLAVAAFEIVTVFWLCLTVVVFLLLRKRLSLLKRIGAALLFLVSPVLMLAWALFKSYMFDDYTSEETVTAPKPVLAAGATFPAGSIAHYEVKGSRISLHKQRTLLDVHSDQPVSLGKLRINSIKPDEYSTELQVALSGDQLLDGWPCAGGDYTIVDPEPNGVELRSCWLSAAREWQGQTVAAGTYVTRNGESNEWLFAVMPKPSDAPADNP
ncbi:MULTISPECIES: hypothetical protein [unclassified Dyella]|uniref:hypothetical protein n=1 Tax=unclassified Dyella TaxID=2634549 RepID=UPI000C837202|nr:MULTISPECIES: hypothetical protein [unclassified Dyella]MDR3446991.1 hypothetical protein [Dyella sp.]PMQ05868.1 hypothetical protein DyAD56_06380 [Dyella sp. AD56]